MIKVTFQEVLVIVTCTINVQEDGNPKISKGKLLPQH